MKPSRYPRTGGESDAPRASPPKALQFKPPTIFRKCMSQSAIESGKSPKTVQSSAPAVRGRKTRHQNYLPVRSAQIPTCGSSNRRREVSGSSNYGLITGDHWSSTRNAAALNGQEVTMTYEDYFKSSESQKCDSGSAVGELQCDKSSKYMDKLPSTSSLQAIVQAVESRKWTKQSVDRPVIEADPSGSNTDIDTTWSSWSSDKIGRSKQNDTDVVLKCPSPSLTCKTTSSGELFKVHLSVRRESTAPSFTSNRKKESKASQSITSKNNISRWKQLNVHEIKSSTVTNKITKSPFSRQSPIRSPQKPKISNQSFRGKQNNYSNSQSPILHPGAAHQSPRKGVISNSGKNTLMNHQNFKEKSRRCSPAMTNCSSSPSSTPIVPRQQSRQFGQISSPSRSSHFSPSWGQNLKVKSLHNNGNHQLVKTSQSNSRRNLKSNDGGKFNLTDAPPLLKLSMTSRSDRSTDSGYQDSLSRATLDWFTAWGLISSEMSERKHKMDSRVTLNTTLPLTTDAPVTVFGSQGSTLRETAVYSIEDPDFCTPAPTVVTTGYYRPPTTGDGLPLSGLDGENVELKSTSPSPDEKIHQLLHSALSPDQIFSSEQKHQQREHVTDEAPEIAIRSAKESQDRIDEDLTDEEISTATQTDDVSQDMLTSEPVSQNVSDTHGVISNMADNISEITDISADWDPSLPVLDNAIKLLNKELSTQVGGMESSPNKDTQHSEKSEEAKSSSKTDISEQSKTETETGKGENSVETKEGDNSAKEESGDDLSMRMLSQSSLTDAAMVPARGLNSNTRRTVEINYHLIMMTSEGGDVTDSEKQASTVRQVTRRSSSVPPRPPPLHPPEEASTKSTSSPKRRHSPTCTAKISDTGGVKTIRQTQGHFSAPAFSVSPKVLKIINSHHSHLSQTPARRDKTKTSHYLLHIPEPKLFYLGCLMVLSMCAVLAFILTSSVIL